jgi:hypothetical protein
VRHRLLLGLLLVPTLLFTLDCRKKKGTKLEYPQGGGYDQTSGGGQTQFGDAGTPIMATTRPTTTSTGPAMGVGPTVVTDADRAAARDLFTEGVNLQKDGKFPEALDRFQRSYSVFAAPTTALRIAQCKVALGKLLEGAEGYRAIANANIPKGSPQAFFDAQVTASQELAGVDPRIPRARINVTPANLPGLQVLIDGQPMNVALVGAARPVDPGSHKVTANAQGYYQVELTFEVKEKEQKDVAVPMKKR